MLDDFLHQLFVNDPHRHVTCSFDWTGQGSPVADDEAPHNRAGIPPFDYLRMRLARSGSNVLYLDSLLAVIITAAGTNSMRTPEIATALTRLGGYDRGVMVIAPLELSAF